MVTAEPIDLVKAAHELLPVIAEGDEESDRERRLPQRVARAMAKAGLYRACVARAWNGHEADPLTTLQTIETVSKASGAAGWNLMIALETSGISSGAMSEQAAQETFLANPELIMCGGVNPLGRARPEKGGWRVSGHWPFCSGCHNADWLWGGSLVCRPDGEVQLNGASNPTAMQVLIPASDFEIVDTWNVAGLRGSGSHTVRVTDVFVPAHRTTDIHGAGMQLTTPLFRYPIMPRFCYHKVGVATGIARAAIDEFVDLAGAKTPYRSRTLLREKAHAQLAVAEAEALLRSGRAFLFETVTEMWDLLCAGGEPNDALRIRHRLAASHAVECAVRAVSLIHRSAGATANFQSSPIERRFRDIHAVQAHATIQPAVYEIAGRAMLGLGFEQGQF